MHKNNAETIAEAAQIVIGNPPKCASKKWISDVTLTLVTKGDNAKRTSHQSKSAATKERQKDLAKQVQASYLVDERPFMERQIAELEQANQQGASRKAWKIMNDISGKLVPCPVGKVKKLNGEIIKSLKRVSR